MGVGPGGLIPVLPFNPDQWQENRVPYPQMNPLTARLLGGVDARKKLQQQLLDAAEATDDPAYRDRLIEAANGKRPLRTLIHDPAFKASIGLSTPEDEQRVEEAFTTAAREAAREPGSWMAGTPEEVRERAREQLRRQGIDIPGVEEMKALFEEVAQLQREAQIVVGNDRRDGWGGSADRVARQAQGGDDDPERP